MNLEIVWRNPVRPARSESRLERIVMDQYGAVYAIRSEDKTRVFELLPGRVA